MLAFFTQNHDLKSQKSKRTKSVESYQPPDYSLQKTPLPKSSSEKSDEVQITDFNVTSEPCNLQALQRPSSCPVALLRVTPLTQVTDVTTLIVPNLVQEDEQVFWVGLVSTPTCCLNLFAIIIGGRGCDVEWKIFIIFERLAIWNGSKYALFHFLLGESFFIMHDTNWDCRCEKFQRGCKGKKTNTIISGSLTNSKKLTSVAPLLSSSPTSIQCRILIVLILF